MSYEQAQKELQNSLTTTFLANLAFLSECNNELYQRVDELSKMIGEGTYKEKYRLEFIIESGDFDIYDISNNKYLYNKDPKKINDELIKKIEFNENNSIAILSSYANIKNPPKIERKNRFDYNYMQELSNLTINDIFEYEKILKDSLLDNKKELKKISKFIFLGTLLGRHIPKIAKKVDADLYLVLEKNLEIFRLSLFTLDYSVLAEKGVVFSIMDKDFDEEKIKSFLDEGHLENYLLKFSTTNINVEEYIDKILANLLLAKPTQYDYNRRLYTHINRTTKYLGDKYKILQFDRIQNNLDFFDNIPILYIASGPSLDENINWIKENQNKFFIVTIGSSYKKLLQNDIKINMVTTLDEQYVTVDDKQFDNESVSKMDKNTIILASMITNKKILEKFNQKNLFLYEVFHPYIENNISFSGFSIGELTLNILQKMNAKEIYIIGLDLALNQKTGETHSKGSNSIITKLNLNKKQNRDTFSGRESLIKVKGNMKDIVFTTSLFYNSIKSLDSMTSNHDDEIKIFNLSLNGAFFKNTIPTKIENIKINTFKEINKKNNLVIELEKYMTNKLPSHSKDIIKKEINYIKENVVKITSEIKNKEFNNCKSFIEDASMILKLLAENKIKLFIVIQEYHRMILPPIIHYFNHKEIRNEKKILNKIKEVYVKQIENIINDYILCLERIIN
ncbi:motility associated factor glycosyltransferase family protein [Poseidonibacter antarcticus]|uniref:motility associated factor glycosyltransferase family protein n=1 Tax=Poseidonibacter antarcticus TaxID=2478538 RepID=UPI000EF55A76|nr:6-hydroxymethylpterin diphosphokinase MptE-like protein [Poseidonibacter antarcticus]